MSLRPQVINLYKRLLYLGLEWPAPQGYPWFRSKVNKAFSANKNETDDEKIENLIKRGEFVEKEIQTLYYLKKYRKLKERYMGEDETKFGPRASKSYLNEYLDKWWYLLSFIIFTK